jgi:hypothetical protein
MQFDMMHYLIQFWKWEMVMVHVLRSYQWHLMTVTYFLMMNRVPRHIFSTYLEMDTIALLLDEAAWDHPKAK